MAENRPADPLARAGFVKPIRIVTRVRRPLDDAFDLFTGRMSSWWPLQRFTFDPARSKDVFMEPHVGGRLYERFSDGEEHIIGHVMEWDPPNRVVFTWTNAEWVAPTEVEVRFVSEDADLTRVELEHRAWERLGAAGLQAREAYANGWPTVLQSFADAGGAT